MTLNDLTIDHPYYCSSANYYSNSLTTYYDTWLEFHKTWSRLDMDLNLLFRWDLKRGDNGSYSLYLFYMLQRKGIFTPVIIRDVTDEDAKDIHSFLEARFNYLLTLWEPFNKTVSTPSETYEDKI
jgi:hypothetical protein